MPHVLTLDATGETAELLADGVATGGARVEFLTALPAHAPGPPLHIHPKQDERFEGVEGVIVLHAGGERIELAKGDVHVVRAGTPHRFENPGPGTARWHVTMTPALNFDYLAEALINLVNAAPPAGPRAEDMAYILSQAPGEYYLAEPSVQAQDAECAKLAPGAIPDVPGGPISLKRYKETRSDRVAALQGGR